MTSLFVAPKPCTRITHPADAAHPDGAFFGTDHDPGSGPGQAALGRPTWLTDPIGSAVAVISYDAAGHPNGIGRPGATTGLNFAGDGRLLGLTHYLAAGLDVQWSFTHNPASQIASETRSNDAYAWIGHYAVNRAYTTNGLNQYSAAGGANFGYDANGNLVTAPGPVAGQTITYTYDVGNRRFGPAAIEKLRVVADEAAAPELARMAADEFERASCLLREYRRSLDRYAIIPRHPDESRDP